MEAIDGEWRMIKHDEKWLDNIDCLAVSYCEEYLAHMTRWRTMDEVPEIGSRIEVAYQCKADWISNWSAVDKFDGEFERYEDDNDMIGHPYAWRPAGELPEVSDVA